MSVLDLFSAAPGIRASNKSANALTSNANKGFNYATGKLTGGFDDALSALQQGVGDATGVLKDWYGEGRKDIGNYSQQAIDALKGGTQQQVGAYQQGIAPWQQLFEQYQPGAETYWGALNGGQGANDAFNQFWNSTGSQSALDRGLEGVSRVGQNTGQLGAANSDAIKYSQDLNQQQFQSFLQDLLPAISGQQAAATGIQKGYGDIGSAYGQQGAGIAELLGNTGSALAGMATNEGTNLGNLSTGLGTATAGLDTSLASQLAKLGSDYYNQQGQTAANKYAQQFGARSAADSNTLSALFGLGGLAVGGLGGGTVGGLGSGFSGLGSGLSSLFSGGGGGGGAFDSMMLGSGFMDNAGNIY